jgi:type IV pilus assembly protein PilA
MRRLVLSVSVAILSSVAALAQSAAPQTARQALLEMFFSKTSGTFVKHLPAATRAALEKAGALNSMEQYSLMMSQMQTQGQNLQTYETGSILLSFDNPKTGDKAEITVENDALRGDQDDLELSFQVYKNGQSQRTPFMPQMTFSMKQEAQVWKLYEISVTIHVPLADKDFLKALTDKVTATQTALSQSGWSQSPGTTVTITPRPEVIAQPGGAGSDAAVIAAVRTILTAQITYATTYPNVGYTCTLSSLDGFGGGEPNQNQAMLINSGLASGKRFGYIFTLSECGGMPANTFHLTATPNSNTFGRKSFCADQSALIRSSQDSSPAACVASGTPVQ